ncbi:Fpg/Nei family DNA glycosylase [Edaphobacter bradus]|uniref:Fpg/Nei family DNA glycosylase n=1 Tax=Edaphobacter bradus TaxID=2259016 RepID=UPI0021DF6864|nr:DNA-formamidopyrimidine glycosylase family protein [Edaphobacter bradus]
MPEGNEIHRWAERHAAAFAGKVVRADGPQGRFADVDVIDGRRLERVMAVGKHLGYDFGKDRILHVHLGLQGDFTEGSGSLPAVKGALRLRMWNAAAIKKPAVPGVSKRHAWYSEDDGTGHIEPNKVAWVELRGPMDCSIYTQKKWDELVERLGPDPLNGDGPDRMIAKVAKSRKPIGELLMDQSVAAGVGNILRAELLFRARLSPFVAGKDVPEKTLRAMWKDLAPLIRAGMADRRIVTTKPKDRPHKTGAVLKEEAHYVYRRNGRPCFVSGTTVMKKEMAGRNLFWCPTCQAE